MVAYTMFIRRYRGWYHITCMNCAACEELGECYMRCCPIRVRVRIRPGRVLHEMLSLQVSTADLAYP